MRDNGGVSEPQTDAPREASIRRAPRLGVFLVVGAVVGLLGTLILTSLFRPDPNVGFAASFAYFCLYGVPAGVAIFAVLGLVLDRASRKRSRTVLVEHQRVVERTEPVEDPELEARPLERDAD